MTGGIVDPEVHLLAAIAATVKADYIRESIADPWEGNPFNWIPTRPSRQRGKIGEQLVAGWCAAKGLDVVTSKDSEADLIIGGRRVEVKFSTLWESGIFTFQQIRDQNYEYAICLGISPFSAQCWVISKELLRSNSRPQHTGRSGRDTFWLSFSAANPPDWLSPCGGTLAQAFQVIQGIRRP